ncbi:MAG TPA: amidohydrolase [Thermomicrobiales bacterium]|nr:amidohydrolase [Thermomicrobiales bacterium]
MVTSLLITNGTIATIDPRQPEAEAVGIIGDRIVAVGNRAMVEGSLPRGYQTLDLAGRFAMPGFNEAHNHMLIYGQNLGQIDASYPAVRSIEDIKARIAERAASTPEGSWIVGWGYDDNKLDERRHPNRHDWDAVAPNHPVMIVNGSGHLSAVNSLALQRAGLSRDATDPQGGHYVRDEHGEMTGVLHETAQDAVRDAVPAPTVEDYVEALGRTNKRYVAAGITSSQDAMSRTPEEIAAFQIASREGILQPRTTLMIRENLLPEITGLGIQQGFGADRLKIGPIKLFIDGSLIGRTAAVTQPFLEDPVEDNLGLTMMPQEELDDYVMQAHRAGFQIAIHAIGDRGIDMVLDAYEKALAAHPRDNHRHRIEHCGILRPDLIERIARMQVLIVTQPIFITEYGDGFIRHLGLERAQLTYPFRSLLDAGITVVFSSDCPVSSFEPLKSIEASVTEKTGSGRSYALEEAISVEEALPLYTVAGAYSTFEEDQKGMLRAGMLADLVVLERDPRAVEPEEISQVPVSQTIIGGETVYEG